jgi:hypothetical protein
MRGSLAPWSPSEEAETRALRRHGVRAGRFDCEPVEGALPQPAPLPAGRGTGSPGAVFGWVFSNRVRSRVPRGAANGWLMLNRGPIREAPFPKGVRQ